MEANRDGSAGKIEPLKVEADGEGVDGNVVNVTRMGFPKVHDKSLGEVLHPSITSPLSKKKSPLALLGHIWISKKLIIKTTVPSSTSK